eukprot:1192872-Prorocentrum_minimum.AAC.2
MPLVFFTFSVPRLARLTTVDLEHQPVPGPVRQGGRAGGNGRESQRPCGPCGKHGRDRGAYPGARGNRRGTLSQRRRRPGLRAGARAIPLKPTRARAIATAPNGNTGC